MIVKIGLSLLAIFTIIAHNQRPLPTWMYKHCTGAGGGGGGGVRNSMFADSACAHASMHVPCMRCMPATFVLTQSYGAL